MSSHSLASAASCLLVICIAPALNAADPIDVRSEAGEFTVVVLPDTQRYSLYFPEIFLSQTQWIKEQASRLNAKFVIHVGDVVETQSDGEWFVADQAFKKLDGRVPYLVVPGNHDMANDKSGNRTRDTTKFNAVFSPYRFAGRSWYGGHKGATSDNSFAYFTAGGQKFLVLGLEYSPSDETLRWAYTLVRKHRENHRVILVTHAYMNDDDTRLGEGDGASPKLSDREWNDGEDIWRKLVNRTNAIRLVLSGHVTGDGTGLLVSRTNHGAQVIQMLANYQHLGHGGEGWLRVLHFKPADGVLAVHTYSPWLNRYRNEPDQRFDVDVAAVLNPTSTKRPDRQTDAH
jgi:hypothetical protein